MTAVTLTRSGAAAGAGPSTPPASDWLQRDEILSFDWTMTGPCRSLATPFRLFTTRFNQLNVLNVK